MATRYGASIENYRALAKIVLVDSVSPIKKADFVEVTHIGGWQCVTKKGEFQPGDRAVYIEIDSLLPIDRPEFAFLASRKESLKVFDEITYSRIKTIKLRGELSQGLLIPVPTSFMDKPVGANITNDLDIRKFDEVIVNTDGLDGKLNSESKTYIDRLVKFVAGPPARSQFGPWPHRLSKSEQDRVQNIGNHFAAAASTGELFEETVKLDGQSVTFYSYNALDEAGEYTRYGVCSRNYDLSLVDIDFSPTQALRRCLAQNIFALVSGVRSFNRTVKGVVDKVKANELTKLMAIKELLTNRYFWFTKPVFKISARGEVPVAYALDNDILTKLLKYNETTKDRITVQGELVGPGIQSNAEGVDKQEFYVYQVYRNGNEWVPPLEARIITDALGLNYIPVLNYATYLPASVKDVLKRAKGKGYFDPSVSREGIVFKSLTRDFSFKVISDDYLLKKEKALEVEEV